MVVYHEKEKRYYIEQTTNKLAIELHIEIIEEDGYFVAYCPALELTSYGKDEKTAKKRFICCKFNSIGSRSMIKGKGLTTGTADRIQQLAD